jgi:NAD(P)-dependent dehydrogenase (short-subunit alcohol dehydrogenase family)
VSIYHIMNQRRFLIYLFRVNSIAQTSVNQLPRTDIRVNSICPGLIETGMTSGTFDYARKRGTVDKIGQLNPLGRYGVAEGMRCFLLLSLSTYHVIQKSLPWHFSLPQVCNFRASP